MTDVCWIALCCCAPTLLAMSIALFGRSR